jgi:hypothetical protein
VSRGKAPGISAIAADGAPKLEKVSFLSSALVVERWVSLVTLATGEAEKLRLNREGLKLSVSVLFVSVRSMVGFSGTGVLAGEACEIVGVSLPGAPGPPYLEAGADARTEELNESERWPASLSGRKEETN